jgi:hypothetical protein
MLKVGSAKSQSRPKLGLCRQASFSRERRPGPGQVLVLADSVTLAALRVKMPRGSDPERSNDIHP